MNLNPIVNPLNQSKDYTVTVTGTSGFITPGAVIATFNLKVKVVGSHLAIALLPSELVIV